MLILSYGSHFLKNARTLPQAQQKKLASLLEILRVTPFHTLLHVKSLTGELAGVYSF